MIFFQKEISINELSRGFHLITQRVINEIPEIGKIKKGILHVFLKHTSAGLTLNENADPSIRIDFENYLNRIVPETGNVFSHNDEGIDDMPAHIKSSIMGCQITIPITSGNLNLGTWQGIYLCEFRNQGESRKLVLTILGE
jgi:secondary thiamine-phosphate synthase enzyme